MRRCGGRTWSYMVASCLRMRPGRMPWRRCQSRTTVVGHGSCITSSLTMLCSHACSLLLRGRPASTRSATRR